MKIKIENRKKVEDYIPGMKHLVEHTNGKVGIIVNTPPGDKVKVICLSELLTDDILHHSKIICEWEKNSLQPFIGKITLET